MSQWFYPVEVIRFSTSSWTFHHIRRLLNKQLAHVPQTLQHQCGICFLVVVTIFWVSTSSTKVFTCTPGQMLYDGVQPKTPPFSTRHLIWVNDKVVSQLFQPIYLSFLYLNSVGHNLVIELCCALKTFLIFVYIYLVNWLTVL